MRKHAEICSTYSPCLIANIISQQQQKQQQQQQQQQSSAIRAAHTFCRKAKRSSRSAVSRWRLPVPYRSRPSRPRSIASFGRYLQWSVAGIVMDGMGLGDARFSEAGGQQRLQGQRLPFFFWRWKKMPPPHLAIILLKRQIC